ncbi:MAG: hypothetical protein WCW03_01320 [Candidatus Paceibacterota bacterium]|jgi:hypothetical protein
MFNISNFLKRIQSTRTKELYTRSQIIDVLKKLLPIDLAEEGIIIKNNTIKIKNISQGAKTTIFMKKQQILDEINKTAGSNLKDILFF